MNENFETNYETPNQEENARPLLNESEGFAYQAFKEKKNIKKSANLIGIALLIILAIPEIWAILYYAVMAAFGYSAQMAYEIMAEPAVMQILQIALSSIMFTLPLIAVFKIGRVKIAPFISLNRPLKPLAFYFLGVSCCALSNILTSYAGAIFESSGIDYNVDYGQNPEGFYGFLLSFIATAIVPAFVEEFACRGIILGSLRKYGDSFALITSAAVFGLMHGNFQQIPFAFLIGLVLGFIALKSESLWIPIAVHFTNNLISVLFDYLFKDTAFKLQNLLYTMYIAVALILGIVALLLLRKESGDFYSLNKGEYTAAEKQKYKWFFTTVTVIIFIAASVISSFAYFN